MKNLNSTFLAFLIGIGLVEGIYGQDWPNLAAFEEANQKLSATRCR